MCMCGPEKEMLLTSLKVGLKILSGPQFVSNKFHNHFGFESCFCVQVPSFGGMTMTTTRCSDKTLKVTAIPG